ncbi:MAG: sel1 repeat family protein [Ruminococcus sp.]|nr:sel1 repeat family protein [Ruminococcus sp.]
MSKLLEEARKHPKLEFLEAKAANGDKIAEFNVGYYNAIGENPDYKKAFSIFKKYADQNLPEALHNLGVMYYFGYGVEKDTEKALSYIKKAAEQGVSEDKILLELLR